MLVDGVIDALGWRYEWVLDYARVLPRHEGERLACPLFRRLAAIGVPVLVVVEYDPHHWQDDKWRAETRRIDDAVLACASAAGLATLDLFETIDKGVRRQGLWTIYRRAHPGAPAGTELAARRIAAELAARHMPPNAR